MAINIPELYLKVSYNQKNITNALAPFVTSIEAEDYIGSKDSLTITLEDSEDKWKSKWYPVKTDTISLEFGYNGGSILKIGKFYIDEISFSAPPDTVHIKAVSADISKPLETAKTRTFKDKSLKQIVSQIATDAGLSLCGDIEDIQFKCRRQNRQSDLGFLKILADEYGYLMAVKENRLIFAKANSIKKNKTALKLDKKDLINITLKDKTHSVYKACTVTYWDASAKKNITYTSSVKGLQTGDTLQIKERAENEQQAKAKAEAALSAKNERQVSGHVSLPGSAAYTAGAQIEFSGLGVLSGIYTVVSAKHSLSSGGWHCSMEIMRNELKPDNTQAAAKLSAASGRSINGSSIKTNGTGTADPMGWTTITDDRGVSYKVRKETAARFEILKAACRKQWPNRLLWISSSTGGTHSSAAHTDGRALDFGIDGLSARDSYTLESLAQRSGFKTYNEYVYRSAYWTGEHMHIYWE